MNKQNKLVIFGAGNIGRSFIGNIFASNGYSLTFIDANRALVDELNSRGSYKVIIKRGNQADEETEVTGIRAVHSSENDKIAEALEACTLCATSVGQGALKFVVPQLADAVKRRAAEKLPPLDVIIAENIRGGADFFRGILRKSGLNGDEAGLVETSIGKMVPIMTQTDLASDPLVLHAEEYNTLILDAEGFRGRVPAFPEVKAVGNIAAWVDRKLFIHNLGHAAAAYFGYKAFPDRILIADVICEEEIQMKVRSAMGEAAAALLAEYPADFTAEALSDHIDDLIFRFGNRALGDTVFRVGRDLSRKLNRSDRILGAAALCRKHGLEDSSIISVFNAALGFRATDSCGKMFESDTEFLGRIADTGIKDVIRNELGVSEQRLLEELIKTEG